MMGKTLAMLGLLCLLVLLIELDFFIALPKFGARHFGAPEDLKELVEKMPDRPKGIEAMGLAVLILCSLGVIGVLAWAFLDTAWHYPGVVGTYFRFAILFEGYKLFDVVVFDWLLLAKIRLLERLCPATKGAKGYDSFGFNAKSQALKALAFLLLATAIAAVYSFFCA